MGIKKSLLMALAGGLAASALVAGRMRSEPAPFDEFQNPLPTVRNAAFTLQCSAAGQPISPSIYGSGGAEPPWDVGVAARRWGGNPTTRYNWETHFTNLTKDWFFKNVRGGPEPAGYRTFLDENRQHGVSTALTVPTIGWVAKDDSSYSFPVAAFGKQEAVAPENADMGNGVGADGKAIVPGPPTMTSIAAPPEFIGRWVQKI